MELMQVDAVPVRGTKTDPVLWLDRLASLFRHTVITVSAESQFNPCKEVILEMWPILSRTLDKYQESLRIMERCCRTIRFMLRCASQQLKEILDSLVGQIIAIYRNYKHSSFLYVGSILVDEYATDVTCIQGLLDMLQALIEPTFNLLRENDGLRNHPDTVDDFFRLCARFMQRAPLAFIQSSSLPHIIQCGLMACSLDHKEANASVMKFFYDLVNTGRIGGLQDDFKQREDMVKRILSEYGQQLITNLIHACVFYLHTYMLSEVADIIIEMLEFDREVVSKWLVGALESLPKQTNGGVISVTPQQLTDIHVSLTRSDTSKSVTHALKDLSRLYR